MPRIFCGNFDFEHELAATRPSRENPRQLVRRIGAALGPAWLGLAAQDDRILTAEAIDPTSLAAAAAAGLSLPRFIADEALLPRGSEWELVPWGWTPLMVELARRHAWSCAAPPLDLVRQLNSREFRLELESKIDVGLPGSAVARSIERLKEIVATQGEAPNGWVLKSNFGMAGRESVRGRGTALPEALHNWAAARIAQVGCVVFEPLVTPLEEAGIQIQIPVEGAPVLVGVTPLIVDRSGTYRGSRFGSEIDSAPWQPAVEVALRVATDLQHRGYFGPLGIDAMRYRDAAGVTRLRPLQDLNARYTMGRLALGFARIVPIGWCELAALQWGAFVP